MFGDPGDGFFVDVGECLKFQQISYFFVCVKDDQFCLCSIRNVFSIIFYHTLLLWSLVAFVWLCNCIGSNIPTLWELKSEQDSGGGEFRSKMRQEEEEAGADRAKYHPNFMH